MIGNAGPRRIEGGYGFDRVMNWSIGHSSHYLEAKHFMKVNKTVDHSERPKLGNLLNGYRLDECERVRD